MNRPFKVLARDMYAMGQAVYCDESCWHIHDGHGCEHEGHACGCPHSASYEFEWEQPEQWSDSATAGLLHFLSALPGDLAADEIESRLEWWSRGENRRLRRAMESAHQRVCERGSGFLANRVTRQAYPAPCRDWRRCPSCARSYGLALSRRWSRVKGLPAFVVLTMPAELGDWRVEGNRRAMMRAWRRLYERLCRRFDRRPKLMHFKEHAGAGGRLHLNVLWDWEWIDQGELSQMAADCGLGPICHISRVGRGVELAAGRAGSSPAVRYSTKTGFRVVAYARKTGSQTAAGDDWPKNVRRWSASRLASVEMGRRQRNPEWCWTPIEPVSAIENAESASVDYWLLPDDYLPSRQPAPRPPPKVLLKPAEQFSLALS